MIDPRKWFQQLWPRPGPRQAVLSDYATVGTLSHFLTDLALRGNVFAPHPATDNLYEAGRMEGRRQLALEVIRMGGEEPSKLWTYIEKSGKSEE